ncbi:TylF/MycF family methyltransferase [Pelagibacteraceae bacterium]|nr:TylF/MycF family methyltransferase [Pelagibacteraceae bacterium]
MDNFKTQYIELFKKVLMGILYEQSNWQQIHSQPVKNFFSLQFFKNLMIKIFQRKSIILYKKQKFDSDRALIKGKEGAGLGYTLVSKKRLDNIEHCFDEILKGNIEGDFIETGVWRGGACILIRELMRINNIKNRKVFVADSFEGMPKPKNEFDGSDLSMFEEIKVSVEEVKSNFDKFGLNDNQVVYIKGWFSESLPKAPINKLALLRLDGDLYHSTMDSLNNLYHKVSKGGYVIVDDMDWPECARAINEFRDKHSIKSELKFIDDVSAYWRVN